MIIGEAANTNFIVFDLNPRSTALEMNMLTIFPSMQCWTNQQNMCTGI